MSLACVLLAVFLLVALVLSWLYGIRFYDAMSRRGHPRDRHPLFHTGRTDRVVALTIDDAPWRYQLPLGVELSTSIEEIGEVLRNHGCSATLMVIGSYLRAAPPRALAAMRQLHADGIVEFANHGYTNSRAASLTAHQLAREINKTEAAVRDWLGSEARMAPFYRPGCGLFHADMLRVAADRGYRTVLGDAYPFDPQLPVSFLLFWHLMITVRPGSIIILHDRPWTPALLRMLLPWLQDQGYRVVMLSRALCPQ
jgi:peptidoglycan/xylan/chitin deacetylase (PgdA/CDA1 family)